MRKKSSQERGEIKLSNPTAGERKKSELFSKNIPLSNNRGQRNSIAKKGARLGV